MNSSHSILKIFFVLYVISDLLVMAGEIHFIDPSDYLFYFAGKLVFIFGPLILGYKLLKKPHDRLLTNSIGVLILLYSVHGQWYRPLYFFAYIQLILCFSLFFQVRFKDFVVVSLGVGSFFVAVFLLRFEDFKLGMANPSAFDLVWVVFIFTVIAAFVTRSFSSYRLFEEELLEKQAIIGQNMAAISHNMSGLMATPRLNIDLLEKKIDSSDKDLTEIIRHTKQSFDGISRLMLDLNFVNKIVESKKEKVELGEILRDAIRIVDPKLRSTQVEANIEGRILADPRELKSIFITLLLNSIETLNRCNIESPKINVSRKGNSVVFSDNGPGFSEDQLRNLRTLGFIDRTDHETRGLGLYLVQKICQRNSWSVSYSNSPGAKVSIDLKQISK